MVVVVVVLLVVAVVLLVVVVVLVGELVVGALLIGELVVVVVEPAGVVVVVDASAGAVVVVGSFVAVVVVVVDGPPVVVGSPVVGVVVVGVVVVGVVGVVGEALAPFDWSVTRLGASAPESDHAADETATTVQVVTSPMRRTVRTTVACHLRSRAVSRRMFTLCVLTAGSGPMPCRTDPLDGSSPGLGRSRPGRRPCTAMSPCR